MLRKNNRRPVHRQEAPDTALVVHPGDMVIFQTTRQVNEMALERLARIWQQHFGSQARAVFLEGEYRITVLQKAP